MSDPDRNNLTFSTKKNWDLSHFFKPLYLLPIIGLVLLITTLSVITGLIALHLITSSILTTLFTPLVNLSLKIGWMASAWVKANLSTQLLPKLLFMMEITLTGAFSAIILTATSLASFLFVNNFLRTQLNFIADKKGEKLEEAKTKNQELNSTQTSTETKTKTQKQNHTQANTKTGTKTQQSTHTETGTQTNIKSQKQNYIETDKKINTVTQQPTHVKTSTQTNIESQRQNHIQANSKTGTKTQQPTHVKTSTQTNIESQKQNHTQANTKTGTKTQQSTHTETGTQTNIKSQKQNYIETDKKINTVTQQPTHVKTSTQTNIEPQRQNHIQANSKTGTKTQQPIHIETGTQTNIKSQKQNHAKANIQPNTKTQQQNHIQINSETQELKQVQLKTKKENKKTSHKRMKRDSKVEASTFPSCKKQRISLPDESKTTTHQTQQYNSHPKTILTTPTKHYTKPKSHEITKKPVDLPDLPISTKLTDEERRVYKKAAQASKEETENISHDPITPKKQRPHPLYRLHTPKKLPAGTYTRAFQNSRDTQTIVTKKAPEIGGIKMLVELKLDINHKQNSKELLSDYLKNYKELKQKIEHEKNNETILLPLNVESYMGSILKDMAEELENSKRTDQEKLIVIQSGISLLIMHNSYCHCLETAKKYYIKLQEILAIPQDSRHTKSPLTADQIIVGKDINIDNSNSTCFKQLVSTMQTLLSTALQNETESRFVIQLNKWCIYMGDAIKSLENMKEFSSNEDKIKVFNLTAFAFYRVFETEKVLLDLMSPKTQPLTYPSSNPLPRKSYHSKLQVPNYRARSNSSTTNLGT